MRARVLCPAVALSAILVSIPTASAELYQCQRPDGSTTFTDNPATCPGAQPHEPTGSVQAIEPSRPAEFGGDVLAPHEITQDSRVEANLESQWRLKKRDAEEELEQVIARTQQLALHIRRCSRGAYLYIEQDNGIRKKLPCGVVKRELANLEGRREVLESYLDRDLEEECRRAGCLPGWLR